MCASVVLIHFTLKLQTHNTFNLNLCKFVLGMVAGGVFRNYHYGFVVFN